MRRARLSRVAPGGAADRCSRAPAAGFRAGGACACRRAGMSCPFGRAPSAADLRARTICRRRRAGSGRRPSRHDAFVVPVRSPWTWRGLFARTSSCRRTWREISFFIAARDQDEQATPLPACRRAALIVHSCRPRAARRAHQGVPRMAAPARLPHWRCSPKKAVSPLPPRLAPFAQVDARKRLLLTCFLTSRHLCTPHVRARHLFLLSFLTAKNIG